MFVVTPIESGKAALPPSLTEVVSRDLATIFSGNAFISSIRDKLVLILPPRPILARTSLKLFSFPLKILFTLKTVDVESVFWVVISNSSIIDSLKLSFTDKVMAASPGDCTLGFMVFAHTFLRTVSL